MIYFICVGIVCLSAYVGKVLTSSLIKRDLFYKEYVCMLEYFTNHISFMQSKVDDLFSGYLSISGDNKYAKEIYLIYLKIRDGILDFNISYLKKQEKEKIVLFFKELGCLDKELELTKLEFMCELMREKSRQIKEVREINEGLIYKVSIAIGVTISILIL